MPSESSRIYFSSIRGIFSRIDHILGHKSRLSKLKKTEIKTSIFFQPQCYEEITGKNIVKKPPKYMETTQYVTKQ